MDGEIEDSSQRGRARRDSNRSWSSGSTLRLRSRSRSNSLSQDLLLMLSDEEEPPPQRSRRETDGLTSAMIASQLRRAEQQQPKVVVRKLAVQSGGVPSMSSAGGVALPSTSSASVGAATLSEETQCVNVSGSVSELEKELMQKLDDAVLVIQKAALGMNSVEAQAVFQATGSIGGVFRDMVRQIAFVSGENLSLRKMRGWPEGESGVVITPAGQAKPMRSKAPEPIQKPVQKPVVRAVSLRTASKARSKSRGKALSYSVVVQAVDGDMESQALRRQVMKGASDVRVKAVRDQKNGGLRIDTCSLAELTKLVDSEVLKDAGLRAEAVKMPSPKLVIMGVEDKVDMDDFMAELFRKNVGEELNVSLKNFEKEIRVVSRSSEAKGGVTILEVNERLRNAWLKARRVYIGWTSYRVRPFYESSMSSLSCYRCFGIDHFGDKCKLVADVCRQCGVEGHMASACTKTVSCRNCRLQGLPHTHAVTSAKDCPIFKRAIERRQKSRTVAQEE